MGGLVMNTWLLKLVIIDANYRLSPFRPQTITRSKAGSSPTGPLVTKLNQNTYLFLHKNICGVVFSTQTISLKFVGKSRLQNFGEVGKAWMCLAHSPNMPLRELQRHQSELQLNTLHTQCFWNYARYIFYVHCQTNTFDIVACGEPTNQCHACNSDQYIYI